MSESEITAVVIRRSNDENTAAIVKANVDPAMITTPDELFGAISQAVTKWVAEGSDKSPGQTLLRENLGDINIGDLDAQLASPYLAACLHSRGVLRLEINCYVGDQTQWDYDDNLYDAAHLE